MLVFRRRRGGLLGGGIEVVAATAFTRLMLWVHGVVSILRRVHAGRCCNDTQCRCSTAYIEKEIAPQRSQTT